MKSVKSLPFKNILKRPARSMALIILSIFLSVSAFAGTVVVSSLQNGLSSLTDRLGADIIVVPYEASTKGEYESVILQGNPGHFYMDKSNLKKIASTEGIAKYSAQFFLASAKAGCCSSRVQIIGFDPDTDFSVTPWISRSYSDELKLCDVVIGSDISLSDDLNFKIFGQKLHIVAQLDKTGTKLDTAVYANNDTVKKLIKAAVERNFAALDGVDSDKVISSVLIKVGEGYSADDVADEINLRVKGIRAFATKNMITSVTDSLGGVSAIIGVMIAVVWVLALIIMAIAFSMIINERKREFAVLRVLGASRVKLSGIVFKEAVLISLAGSLIGAVITLATVVLFSGLIENSLGLPFLIPPVGSIALLAFAAIVLTVLAGALTASVSAYRISRLDTGLILRGDN